MTINQNITITKSQTIDSALKPFQRESVTRMVKQKRILNSDDCGLGKGLQAIAAIHELQAYPCLIICPASLKYMWAKEWAKWTTKKGLMLSGTKPHIIDTLTRDLAIINYDILHAWKEMLVATGFKSVIVDESHKIANNSRMFKATKYIVGDGTDYEIPIRICLSGTPIQTKPSQLANQIEVLGYGNEWEYNKLEILRLERLYKQMNANLSENNWIKDLNQKLLSSFMIRRKKEDVLPELPERSETIIPLEIDNTQTYCAYEHTFKDKLSRNNMSFQERKLRADQLRRIVAKQKLRQFFEWLDLFLIAGEKIVVFAYHREIQEALITRYTGKSLAILGGMSAKQKDSYVERFQNNDIADDKESQLMICSVKAANAGLTLTAASYMAFLELSYIPSELEQACARIHRIGQKKPVTIYHFLALDTIDMRMWQLIQNKLATIDTIIDGQVGDLDVKLDIFEDLVESYKQEQETNLRKV